MIPKEDIDNLKQSINIIDIISEYIDLKASGKNFKGLCPFHQEKTPSFTVSEENQRYKCFGCGEGGDIFSFLMKKENMSYIEAVRFLSEKTGIPLREDAFDAEEMQSKKKLLEINQESMMFYYRNLLVSKIPQNYLKRRNISSRLINRFMLGYADKNGDSLYRHLTEKGYEIDQLEEVGLISKSKDGKRYYDRFRDRLIFPIVDLKGHVVGFGGRIIGEGNPKYLNSQESKVFHKGLNLYGMNIISKSNMRDTIILVEGYMDVIAMNNYDVPYAVASLGTALTPEQAKQVSRYGKNVYICYDSDVAGINATLKAIQIFSDLNIKIKIISLPDGMDPDDYIKTYGKNSFIEQINNSSYPIDFEIGLKRKKYNLAEFSEKILFIEQIVPIVARIDNQLILDAYVEKISAQMNLDPISFHKEIDKYLKKNKHKSEHKGVNLGKYGMKTVATLDSLDYLVMAYILSDKKYYDRIEHTLDNISEHEIYVEIISYIRSEYRLASKIYFQEMEAYFSSDDRYSDVLDRVDSILANDEINEDHFQILLNRIKYHLNMMRRSKIQEEIAKLTGEVNLSEEEQVLLKNLTQEFQTLNKSLKRK